MSYEKLRSIGIRAGVSHGKNTWLIVFQVWFTLTLKLVARSTHTASSWVAPLNHKVWNHTVKNDAVVKAIGSQAEKTSAGHLSITRKHTDFKWAFTGIDCNVDILNVAHVTKEKPWIESFCTNYFQDTLSTKITHLVFPATSRRLTRPNPRGRLHFSINTVISLTMPTPETFKDSRYKVPNLERALVMMEHLLNHPRGRSAAELTEDLGFSKNSVFRITMTLLNHHFLVRDETKRFKLSKKLLLMGCRSFGDTRFIEHALDVMRICRDEIKESVFIGTLVEHEGVVIEQVLGSHPFKFSIDIGARMPIHCAAPCKAILAYLPDSEREIIIDAAKFKRYNENTITNKRAYIKELKEVRHSGFALDRAEQIHGAHCVAAPVFDQYGHPIAAIWTTGPSDRIPSDYFDELGSIIRKHAGVISNRMGFNDLASS